MLGIGEQSRPAQRTSDCNQPDAEVSWTSALQRFSTGSPGLQCAVRHRLSPAST